jgi:hypothetical protein
MTISVATKLFQCQQAKFAAEVPHAQFSVVVVVFPLQLHTAKPHADPGVKLLERPATSRELSSEVVRRTPDNLVKFLDHGSVKITVAYGKFPYLGFELLHGFVPHASGVGRKKEPQELIPFPEGCNLRLLGAQGEAQIRTEYMLDQIERLLRLLGGLGTIFSRRLHASPPWSTADIPHIRQ